MLKKTKAPIPKSKPKYWIRDVDFKELKECPETLELVVNEIIEFAYSNKAKTLGSFYREYRANQNRFNIWRKDLPALDEALKELQAQVHIYRSELWTDKKMADTCFLRYAYLHDESEREIDKYHDGRKKDERQESGIVFIRDVPAIVTGKIKPRVEISNAEEVIDDPVAD